MLEGGRNRPGRRPRQSEVLWARCEPGSRAGISRAGRLSNTVAPRTAQSVELVRDYSDQIGNSYAYGSFSVSPYRKTLYFTWRVLEQNAKPGECVFKLYAVPANDFKSPPRQIGDCLPVGESLAATAVGLYVTGSRASLLVDPADGKAQEWEGPETLRRHTGVHYYNDFVPSPDGTRWVSFGPPPDEVGAGAGKLSGATVLYITAEDGTDRKAITPTERPNP